MIMIVAYKTELVMEALWVLVLIIAIIFGSIVSYEYERFQIICWSILPSRVMIVKLTM